MRFIYIVVCDGDLLITIIVFILLFEHIVIYLSILLLMDFGVSYLGCYE